MIRSTDHRQLIYWLAVIGSILISSWYVYIDEIINNDGIRYIVAAREIVDGHFSLAVDNHRWPFYSVIIALVNSVFDVELELSAHIINAALLAFCMVGFLLALKELGASDPVLWIGLLVILLFPGINEQRSFIIRDHGYLAFLIWGLVYLLRYSRLSAYRYLAISLLAFFLATLFRIEGLAFGLVAALIAILDRLPGRKRIVLSVAGAVLIVGLGIVFLLWLFSPGPGGELSVLISDPIVTLMSAWDQITVDVMGKLKLIQDQVLTPYSRGYAYFILLLAAIGIVAAETVAKLTPVLTIVVLYSLRRRVLIWPPAIKRIWWSMIAMNVIILLLFALSKLFLTERYTLALSLIFLLAVPFTLDRLWQLARRRVTPGILRKFLLPLLGLALILSALDGLGNSTRKVHIKQAGIWLKENVEAGETVYSSNQILAYYTGLGREQIKVREPWLIFAHSLYLLHWKEFDYLAVSLGRRRPKMRQDLNGAIQFSPIKTFSNRRGDEVLIFDIRPFHLKNEI